MFLDKREYTGPLYEQIDDAVDFVLRNIRLGARIVGIQRKEDYELPVGAIREMIINAHCNRSMTDESCIQVAIYDNRISAAGIARRISVTQRTVERYIRALREEGKLVRHGPARGGYWEVVEVGEQARRASSLL